MLKYLPIRTAKERMSLVWDDLIVLAIALVMIVVAFVYGQESPLIAIWLLIASVVITGLALDRIAARQSASDRPRRTAPPTRSAPAPSAHPRMLDRALDRAIQRSRARASEAEPGAVADVLAFTGSSDAVVERTVAVLSFAVRQTDAHAFGSDHVQQLAQAVLDARRISRHAAARIDVQGDGTVVMVFGAERQQPVRASMRQALDVARALGTDHPDLRFGLSCGSASICALPALEPTLIGVPLADAVRLSRMAVAWHEFHVLCAEPVALLAHTVPSQRTTLTLTYAHVPALPIYALDLDASLAAASA